MLKLRKTISPAPALKGNDEIQRRRFVSRWAEAHHQSVILGSPPTATPAVIRFDLS